MGGVWIGGGDVVGGGVWGCCFDAGHHQLEPKQRDPSLALSG
jgi:hypothetical protein